MVLSPSVSLCQYGEAVIPHELRFRGVLDSADGNFRLQR